MPLIRLRGKIFLGISEDSVSNVMKQVQTAHKAKLLTIKEREKKTISIKDGQTNRHIFIDTITIR